MFETGYILDGRYEIIGRIGQGGMSTVYKAKDLRLDREVAIKLLKDEFCSDEEFIERFKNEARSAAKLSHGNIVAAYDIVNSEDRHYIVMELVEGISLRDYIARKGRLSNKETLGIALQAAEGLAEAHRNNIVHRDIKSQNIIISKEGRIKIADFGIARAVSTDTMSSPVIGSAHYISPEQAKTGQADARSDIYSLGICMYEMITGRLPFQGENTVNVVMAHIQDVMVPPVVYNSEIYPSLNDIILKASKKAPEERYQSAEELIEDLKHSASSPEGHFVRLYDTVGSGHLSDESVRAAECAAEDEDTGSSLSQNEADHSLGGHEFSAGGRQGETGEFTDDSDEDPYGIHSEDYDDSRPKLISLGITALIILIIAAAVFLMLRFGKDSRSVAETTAVSASEEKYEESTAEMNYTLSIQGEDVMPDLSGMSVDEARALLSELRLSMDASASDFSDTVPKGLIMNQSPSKNEVLTSDSMVYVTVSLGSESEYILENVKNRNAAEARAALERTGKTVNKDEIRVFSDEIPEDNVMDISIDENTGIVTLTVSYGKEENYTAMPDITGIYTFDAIEILQDNELLLGKATAVNSDTEESNIVASQSTAAGEYIKKGSMVDIEVYVDKERNVADGTDLSGGLESSADDRGLSGGYYYASIDTSCVIGGNASGPGSGNERYVAVRLGQRVGGSMEYTMLTEPIPVAVGSRIPVTFKNIKGAFGVTEGTIEVYDSENGTIFSSYVVTFKAPY